MDEPTSDRLRRVADFWDEMRLRSEAMPLRGWLDSALVRDICLHSRLSDTRGVTWVDGVMERFGLGRGGRWLSLGCGAAATEIELAKRRVFDSLDAFDASPLSREAAKKAALEAGVVTITFDAIDLNNAVLPPGRYDTVVVEMALHHVLELDGLLRQVSGSLKAGGHLLVNEFVGPRQFQFSDVQLAIVRDLLDALPPCWRRDSWAGGLKGEYVRPTIDQMNETDPSEAIRSDQIPASIEAHFDVLGQVDYGGTLLMLLLEHIVHNFDATDEKDVGALRLLARAEELLMRFGVIPSDFAVICARKRGAGTPEPLPVRERRADTPLFDAGPAAASTAGLAVLLRRLQETEAARKALELKLRAIEESRGWRSVQWLRALVGRRW